MTTAAATAAVTASAVSSAAGEYCFADLWQNLCATYERNQRDMLFAYGESVFAKFNRAYHQNRSPVWHIVVTNQGPFTEEYLNVTLKKRIFIAALTLRRGRQLAVVAAEENGSSNSTTEELDWLGGCKLFRTLGVALSALSPAEQSQRGGDLQWNQSQQRGQQQHQQQHQQQQQLQQDEEQQHQQQQRHQFQQASMQSFTEQDGEYSLFHNLASDFVTASSVPRRNSCSDTDSLPASSSSSAASSTSGSDDDEEKAERSSDATAAKAAGVVDLRPAKLSQKGAKFGVKGLRRQHWSIQSYRNFFHQFLYSVRSCRLMEKMNFYAEDRRY